MKFRTEIILPPAELRLSHSDAVGMLGSCFVENISTQMIQSGFNINVNPFGIVYNPVTLATGLRDLIDKKRYTEADLFLYQEVYHSFSHHSRFSSRDSVSALEKINAAIACSSAFLRQANCLILTFGTANVYRLASTGQVVSNCHKLPAKSFVEERLRVEQITQPWNLLIRELQTLNPELKILFTVSPVRHWKDGAHANQLNKAILLLAVNELVQSNPRCYYFPAYEIMLDDLRDYRFYADDLIHPNSQAINYIWEKFGDLYFDRETKAMIKEHEKRHKAQNHRPIVNV